MEILPPDQAGSRVFPIVPAPCTLRRDTERAGVEKLDRRERKFTGHSARKWLENMLDQSGCPDLVRDHLMRHTSGVADHYRDPPLAVQAQAVARLPAMWITPEELPRDQKNTQDGLTNGRRNGNITQAKSVRHNQRATPPRGPSHALPQTWPSEGGANDAGGFLAGLVVGPGLDPAGQFDAAEFLSRELGITAQNHATDQNEALAGVLEALARLLRQRG